VIRKQPKREKATPTLREAMIASGRAAADLGLPPNNRLIGQSFEWWLEGYRERLRAKPVRRAPAQPTL
jgi:hypothetical protein